MNRFLGRISVVAALLAPGLARAQAPAAVPPAPASTGVPTANDFLEHVVDWILGRFGVTLEGTNTTTHFVVSAVFLVAAFLLRRVVTSIIFHFLKKAAARTETTLDDKLFPALEKPVATFIAVTGLFAAFKVLKLSESADLYIGHGATVAFSLVIFWGLFRAFSAVLDHAQEIAVAKQMGVAAFMPWIRKTLVAVFVIIGGLLTIQSLGYDVKTLLTGLGIGGLAFALAAQDTIANLFGSIVVAIDQPFKVGETVKIGASQGTVEEIGLRSTKIRLVDQSLVAIPNRTVSNEAIVNLSRFTGRRSEQVFGLTYDTTPEQLEAMVAEVRRIITEEPEVDPASVLVFFRDLSASSLDIWSVYVTRSPGNAAHLAVRQRINLAIMRAVASRGLSFAFPTQTVIHDGPVAKAIAEKK